MTTYLIDFETRSRVDLKECGAYRYGLHDSTEVMIMSWCDVSLRDAAPVNRWLPGDPFPFGDDFRIVSYNAEFEWLIWNGTCVAKYDWPVLPVERVYCSMAEAWYWGYPRGGLDAASLYAFGAGKDDEGSKAMKRLCKPWVGRKIAPLVRGVYEGGEYKNEPQNFEKMAVYCDRDVLLESRLFNSTPNLPKWEREVWKANQAINTRGVPVDRNFCENADRLCQTAKRHMEERFAELVPPEHVASANCVQALKDWLKAEYGENFYDLSKETVAEFLQDPSVDPELEEILKIRVQLAAKSNNKYHSILCSLIGNRSYGAHLYGKGGTMRYSGRGAQLQNIARLPEDPELITLAGKLSSDEWELSEWDTPLVETIDKLGSMVRLAIRATPGKTLLVADWSGIEMRILHWLAGDTVTLDNIRAFDHGEGPDMYVVAAAGIFGVSIAEVTKQQRQCGKVQILACGYRGGAGAVDRFCKMYGVDLDDETKKSIPIAYRKQFPHVLRLWDRYAKFTHECVSKRSELPYGPVKFDGTDPTYFRVHLPSGRSINYRDPKVVNGPYGPEVEVLDVRSGGRRSLSICEITENVDQAIGRDLLSDALVRCESEGVPVVLHVHDEIVAESGDPERDKKALSDIMNTAPEWAKGLPLAAKPVETERYCK